MEALAALIPSIGVGFLFYLAIRAVINADRRERAAMAALDAAERSAAQRDGGTGQQDRAAEQSATVADPGESTSGPIENGR